MKIDLSQSVTVVDSFKKVSYVHIDSELYEKVHQYRLRFASKYKSISKDAIDKIQGNEFYISVKIDGEHAHLYLEDDKIFVIRHQEDTFYGLPFLEDAKAILQKAGIKRALIPGEFYVRKTDGSRTRVFDVVALTKRPQSFKELGQLCFAPFDILVLDDEVFNDYSEVWLRLRSIFGETKLPPPQTIVSRDRRDIGKFYRHWVEERGAEGLMIRSDLTFRYKLKAQHTIDAVVIGYTANKNEVTGLLTALMNERGEFQVLAQVSKGIRDEIPRLLFDRLSKLQCDSQYIEVSKFHTPFFMVKPQVVIEFSSNDIVAERANGEPIRKASLSWANEGYRLLKSAPFVALKHCVLLRLREDKSVDTASLRLAQITDFVFLDSEKRGAEQISFPPPRIFLREVYTKQVQENISVRKILVLGSNKSEIDPAFPAYVLNFTDFSPNRKNPLAQEVKISGDKSQMMEFVEAYRKKYIKKGWQKVETTAQAEGDS